MLVAFAILGILARLLRVFACRCWCYTELRVLSYNYIYEPHRHTSTIFDICVCASLCVLVLDRPIHRGTVQIFGDTCDSASAYVR